MMRPFSIRARLTAWYTVMLGVSLAVFAVTIWLALRHAMLLGVDDELRGRAAGLARFLKAEASTDNTALVAAEAREYGASLSAAQSIHVWDYNHRLIYALPKRMSGVRAPVRTLRRDILLGGRLYPVELGTSLESLNSTLRSLTTVMIAAIPLVLLLAGGGGWWMSRRAMAPVDAMTREAHALGIRNLGARVVVPATADELARLAEAWNGVLARLQAAVERLTRFTADASHELRNPVAVIRTTAELALRQPRTGVEYRLALVQIEDESRHITRLIEDLLALARSVEGPSQFRFETVDLGLIARDVCAEARAAAERKQIVLSAACQTPPLPVSANPAMLRRLAVLLVDNALKFTGAGGAVTVSAMPGEDCLILEVKDTGCGISPEDLPHIFERFWRAGKVRTANGTGLGLSLAQAIVELHGGAIDVHSGVNQGSVFAVRLPSRLAAPVAG